MLEMTSILTIIYKIKQERSIGFESGGGGQSHPKTLDKKKQKIQNSENPNLGRGV